MKIFGTSLRSSEYDLGKGKSFFLKKGFPFFYGRRIGAKNKKVLDYEAVFYRSPETSVRAYSEEDDRARLKAVIEEMEKES